MTPFPFIGPAYESRSPNYSAQRCLNLYLELGKGKTPAMLVGTPGIQNSGNSPPYPVRGMMALSDTRSVQVSGERVYLVDQDLETVGDYGTISDDGLPVSMAWDGTNLVICSGGYLYGMTLASFLGGAAWTPAIVKTDVSSVDFIDGYFVLSELGSGRFFSSGQYTTTIDGLDFATAEAAPDNLVRLLVSNREVLLFGTNTTEVWYNSGNADFPFSRVQGAVIQEGLAARDSAVVCGTTVAWLGNGANVWTLEGYTPKLISNPAISYAISQWPDPSDARAFFYKQEGHAFYVLSSPSGDQTWCYDFSTGEWHERGFGGSDGLVHRILPECYMFFNGRHLVGGCTEESRADGLIGDLKLDYHLDGFYVIPRVRTCASLQDGLRRQRNKTLTLDMDTGVGLEADIGVDPGAGNAGADPVARLRYSKDGGMTWSAGLLAKLGRIGKYRTRVRWHRVGGGEREVFEVTITDPVKVCITGAYLG